MSGVLSCGAREAGVSGHIPDAALFSLFKHRSTLSLLSKAEEGTSASQAKRGFSPPNVYVRRRLSHKAIDSNPQAVKIPSL